MQPSEPLIIACGYYAGRRHLSNLYQFVEMKLKRRIAVVHIPKFFWSQFIVLKMLPCASVHCRVSVESKAEVRQISKTTETLC